MLETNTFTPGSSGYDPPWTLDFTSTGAEDFEFVVTKTDAGAGVVRVDKYEYEVLLPTLHGGSTVTVSCLITGSPTDPGNNATVTIWY